MREIGGRTQGRVEVATFAYRLKLYQERKRIADLISGTDELNLSQIVACLLLPKNADKDSPMVISTDQTVLKRQLAPLVDMVAKRVEKLLQANLQRHPKDDNGAGSKPPDAPETESKFAMPGKLIRANFGSQMLYRRGLAGLIGLPSVNVREAMEDEHKSEEPFQPPNYGTKTYPKLEWEFVANPSAGKIYPGEKTATNRHGRERKPLGELLQQSECVNCNLTEDELIAIRLYTGPMYAKYNQINRAALWQYMTEELLQVLENWAGEPCLHMRDKASCQECSEARKVSGAGARVGLINGDQLVEYATRFFGFNGGCCVADAVKHLEKVLEERGAAPSGLKWQNVGPTRPNNSQEMDHFQLREALQGKTAFTQQEWDGFGITTLRMDHFVKGGDNYFKPVRGAKRKVAASFPFVTTIHMVASAIIKLSGQTPMPEGRTLYRGLSGIELPSCFFLASKQGCRSGVEGTFMSCSTSKNVARQYAGKGLRSIIFEIAVGEIDIGADVRNLSQVRFEYAHESRVFDCVWALVGNRAAGTRGSKGHLVCSLWRARSLSLLKNCVCVFVYIYMCMYVCVCVYIHNDTFSLVLNVIDSVLKRSRVSCACAHWRRGRGVLRSVYFRGFNWFAHKNVVCSGAVPFGE